MRPGRGAGRLRGARDAHAGSLVAIRMTNITAPAIRPTTGARCGAEIPGAASTAGSCSVVLEIEREGARRQREVAPLRIMEE